MSHQVNAASPPPASQPPISSINLALFQKLFQHNLHFSASSGGSLDAGQKCVDSESKQSPSTSSSPDSGLGADPAIDPFRHQSKLTTVYSNSSTSGPIPLPDYHSHPSVILSRHLRESMPQYSFHSALNVHSGTVGGNVTNPTTNNNNMLSGWNWMSKNGKFYILVSNNIDSSGSF